MKDEHSLMYMYVINLFLCQCRHLLSLKHYEGDVEELDLNFTTISSEFGQSKVCVCTRVYKCVCMHVHVYLHMYNVHVQHVCIYMYNVR